MPHFGSLSPGLQLSGLVPDTSFVETHHAVVVLAGVAYYLPVQLVPPLNPLLREDGSDYLREDGTPIARET